MIPEPRGRKKGWGGVIASVIAIALLGVVVVYVLLSNEKSKKDVPPVQVATVVGQPYDTAAATLTAAGFEVVRQDDELSKATPNTVIGQNPAGGRLADKGSTVTLTVSSSDSTIPDLAGQQYESAAAALVQIGLVPKRSQLPRTPPARWER